MRILVDAEHFRNQDIFDEITEQTMEMFNTKREDPRIFSSQLYGMSDNISFVMAAE